MPSFPGVATLPQITQNVRHIHYNMQPENFGRLADTQQFDLHQAFARGQAIFGLKEKAVWKFFTAKLGGSMVMTPGGGTRPLSPLEYSMHRRNSDFGIDPSAGRKALEVHFGGPVADDHPAWALFHAFLAAHGIRNTNCAKRLYVLDLDAGGGGVQPGHGPLPDCLTMPAMTNHFAMAN